MQEALENSATSDEKTILTLVKTDGKWLITDLEENRPGADTADTSEEAAAAPAEESDAAGESAAAGTTEEETAK